jgi:hypothetical protein
VSKLIVLIMRMALSLSSVVAALIGVPTLEQAIRRQHQYLVGDPWRVDEFPSVTTWFLPLFEPFVRFPVEGC